MIRTLLLAATLLAAAPPALAQAPAPSAPPPAQAAAPADPQALAEANRMIATLNLGQMMDRTIAAIRPGLAAQLQQAGRATPEQVETAMNEIIVPALQEARPQLLAGIAEIWARHFTAAELRDLLAFYETPIGRKSLAVTPQIAAETQMLTQRIVPQILNDTIARNRDALRQRGIQL